MNEDLILQQLRVGILIGFIMCFALRAEAVLSSLLLQDGAQRYDLKARTSSKVQFVTYKKFKLYRLGMKSAVNLEGYTLQEDSSAVAKSNATAVLLFVDNLSGQVSFRNASGQEKQIQYNYQLDAAESGIKINKCNDYNLNIKATKKVPAGTTLAFSCEKVNNRILFTISTLGTAEINSTSLSELDGKGETWRAFDLGTIKAEESTVLELNLSKNSQDFGIKINSKKLDNEKNKKKPEEEGDRQIFTAGLAYSMINLSLVNSYSDASPGLFVGFTSKPLFYSTKFNAEFKQGFSADDPKAIAMSDLKLGAERGFELGSKSFLVVPKLLFVNTKYSQQLSKLDISLVGFGAGLGFDYLFSKREKFQFIYEMTSFGSESVSSASSMQLKINFLLFGGYNFNVGLEMQNLAGKSSSGNAIKVDHNTILLGMGFD